MPVRRVSPEEAAKLLEQGWKYVDVRSEPEFLAGHPEGAYNVPLMHKGAAGMTANPEFAAVMEAAFDHGEPLVVGCRSGQRSLRAAELLASRGFAQVVDMRGGFAGERNPAGAVVAAGWQDSNLPVATTAQTGRTYRELQDRSKETR